MRSVAMRSAGKCARHANENNCGNNARCASCWQQYITEWLINLCGGVMDVSVIEAGMYVVKSM